MDTTYYTSDGCAYTGMTTETIEALRLDIGRTPTVFISRDEYFATIEKQQIQPEA